MSCAAGPSPSSCVPVPQALVSQTHCHLPPIPPLTQGAWPSWGPWHEWSPTHHLQAQNTISHNPPTKDNTSIHTSSRSLLPLVPRPCCHAPSGDPIVGKEWLPARQPAVLDALKVSLGQLLHEEGQHAPLPRPVHHQQAMAELREDEQEVQVGRRLGMVDLTRASLTRHGKHDSFPVEGE